MPKDDLPAPAAYQPKDFQVKLYAPVEDLRQVPGETSHAIITRVEDTKGHPGINGQIKVTNLRLLWYLSKNMAVNVSIGFHTIITYQIKQAVSGPTGNLESLVVLCKDSGKPYEFIFNAVKTEQSVFRFFETAYKNYLSSAIYREQKLRSSVIQDGSLCMLPNEQVTLHYDSVANFSGEIAKLGTAIITNLRFVWYSEIVSNFNVSIPLIILPEIRISTSKRYGKCIYLKLVSAGNSFMYGFTIQPEAKLIEFAKAFEKVRFSASKIPMYTPPLKEMQVEEPTIIESQDENEDLIDDDASLSYLPVNPLSSEVSGKIVFDKTLGLAIEPLGKGTTIESRWQAAASAPLEDLDMI